MDTGAWIALRNRNDELHTKAIARYDELTADRARLLTTSYVLDETATRLRYDLGLDVALAFRDTIREAERQGRLRVVWVDRRIEGSAWDALSRYADVPLSFTDAVTIAIARSMRIREVFGFDEDFRAAGLAVAPGR